MSDEEELIQDMMKQVESHLSKLDKLLLKAQNQPNNPRALDEIHSEFHAVNSMVSFFEYKSIESIADTSAELLNTLRTEGRTLKLPMITNLLQSIDAIRDILNDIQNTGEEPIFIYAELIKNLNAFNEGHDDDVTDAADLDALKSEHTPSDNPPSNDVEELLNVSAEDIVNTEEELNVDTSDTFYEVNEQADKLLEETQTEDEAETISETISEIQSETRAELNPPSDTDFLNENQAESLINESILTNEAKAEATTILKPMNDPLDLPLEDSVSNFILLASRSVMQLKEHFASDEAKMISSQDLNALSTVCRTIADFIEHQLHPSQGQNHIIEGQSENQHDEAPSIAADKKILLAENSMTMKKILSKSLEQEDGFTLDNCDNNQEAIFSKTNEEEISTLILDPIVLDKSLQDTLNEANSKNIKVIFYTELTDKAKAKLSHFQDIPMVSKAGLINGKKISLNDSLSHLRETLHILHN